MFENKDDMIEETMVDDNPQTTQADAEQLMDEQFQTEQEEQAELTPEEYRNLFVALREKYNRKIFQKGSIEAEKIMKEAYDEVCELAVGGDSTAQALLANWFKHGNQALPENIEYSMKWLVLSGAHENKHSIDKLAMLFSFIYDTIVFTEEFQEFSEIFGLTEHNYKYCLGPMICMYIVKNMDIDAFDLVKQPLTELHFNSVTMNRFTNMGNKAVDEILETLKKANEKAAKMGM